MDDKGCLLLCGFGLPLSPTTHIATRAVAAGMNIKRLMVRAKITVTIGITVGKNYCGLIGSRQRQEYTIMGDFVNLAARLMKVILIFFLLLNLFYEFNSFPKPLHKQAKINEGVLCDERTYTTAKQFVKFAPPEEIMVKGKAKPIMAYKPLGKEKIKNKQQTRKMKKKRARAKTNKMENKGFVLIPSSSLPSPF